MMPNGLLIVDRIVRVSLYTRDFCSLGYCYKQSRVEPEPYD